MFPFSEFASACLGFVCSSNSASACVCQHLSAFVCVCSHVLTPPLLPPLVRKNPVENIPGKQKAYTTTTERKLFGELFWPQRKPFQAGGGYKNPIKTRKAISTTEIFPLWTPSFSAKKSSALEQAGVSFLFPSFPQIADFYRLSWSNVS